MKTGMLWYDNDSGTTLGVKVERAANYYHRKYGLQPDLCLVHPSMLPAVPQETGKIAIRANRAILPGHLWLGVEEKN